MIDVTRNPLIARNKTTEAEDMAREAQKQVIKALSARHCIQFLTILAITSDMLGLEPMGLSRVRRLDELDLVIG